VSLVRKIGFALAILVAIGVSGWVAAAIYFDSPLGSLRPVVAVLYLIAMLAAIVFLRPAYQGALVALAGFVIVALWWFSLKPSDQRNWQPDNAETAYADVNGDQVTIHNFRNCNYRTETDYTCQWETRSYNLANLSGADIFITWWGSPWIAHPIVSFDFGDQGHVAMSIETRDEVGQDYSAIRGFFRQYALTYIASDERDVIRLRTNYRKDEEVYIFRTTVKLPMARKLFLDYMQRANELHARPEWYNAITNNCTTNIAVSAAEAQDIRTRFDWRILLNGKGDEMMYEHHNLVTGGLTLPALRAQAHINPAARAAGDSPDFSKLIREGRVGFSPEPSAAESPTQ
jgi:hypothetical protein